MNKRKRLLALWLLNRFRKKKSAAKKRKYWIHPMHQQTDNIEEFTLFFEKLKVDSTKFFNYFRMSLDSFNELLGKIQHLIQKEDTFMRKCIPPTMMLGVTLR